MKLVSKKDMIFVACIFLVAILVSLFSGGNAVEVHFDTELMSISSTGFEFNIAYTDVEKIELTSLPELGELKKGSDTQALKCGNWNNVIWGDYHLCVVPSVPNCVVVTLKDGRTVVFNYKAEENTADVYSLFQENLAAVQGA